MGGEDNLPLRKPHLNLVPEDTHFERLGSERSASGLAPLITLKAHM